MERKCARCAKWEPYAVKPNRPWYGHCTARKADTYSEASCHKFKDMYKPNK